MEKGRLRGRGKGAGNEERREGRKGRGKRVGEKERGDGKG